ncbi:hypothetical protein DPMN_133886 [Dreissena polymorpha]|uniref:Uncharacterized protein n=1 Tax=Dreissena polymorpha TaxID=45954 RepID=A0A9D4JF96_DREPO|nr:hypothetical protein DPMN_133886 [Dreissena polymorpha]
MLTTGILLDSRNFTDSPGLSSQNALLTQLLTKKGSTDFVVNTHSIHGHVSGGKLDQQLKQGAKGEPIRPGIELALEKALKNDSSFVVWSSMPFGSQPDLQINMATLPTAEPWTPYNTHLYTAEQQQAFWSVGPPHPRTMPWDQDYLIYKFSPREKCYPTATQAIHLNRMFVMTISKQSSKLNSDLAPGRVFYQRLTFNSGRGSPKTTRCQAMKLSAATLT